MNNFDPTKNPNYITGDRQRQKRPGATLEELEKEGYKPVNDPRKKDSQPPKH